MNARSITLFTSSEQIAPVDGFGIEIDDVRPFILSTSQSLPRKMSLTHEFSMKRRLALQIIGCDSQQRGKTVVGG